MSKTKIELPKYRGVVTLIPGGTMQFLDLGFDLAKIKRLKTEYFEYKTFDEISQRERWNLRCITKADGEDYYLDCQTGSPVIDPASGQPDFNVAPTFTVSADKALEPYVNQWVPLPFFRAESQLGTSEVRHRHGPTDWARIKVIPLDECDSQGNTHRIVVAFDTHVQEGIDVEYADPAEGYPALSESDVREGAEFVLFESIKHNSWFLKLDWVNEWLKELFYDSIRRKRPNRVFNEADLQNQTEHLARYIAFLELLAQSTVIPRVRLVDCERNVPIDVDLVLDIGNSRTLGMLIEKHVGNSVSLTNGSILALRDLSSPEITHNSTFNSFVCFARAHFGDSSFARGAGRIKSSFSWPSVVRVGAEANRHAIASRCYQGETSMSSPKRYLWDMKPSEQRWCYAPDPSDPNAEEPPVNSGDFVGFVNNEGFPIHAFDQPRFGPVDGLVKHNPYPVIEPKFSRSSLMMFLLGEILTHALVQINSPAQRGERTTPDIPRRLRRIILTVPPAMSVSERKIFMRWANWAVDVLWRALEWDAYADSSGDYRSKPEIKVNLDEASATQLVFVYNEVAERFSGDSNEYFRVFGKVRPSYSNAPTLRVASIDIGGGTTDMVVTTYLNQSVGPTNIIVPKQDFREGFNFAGDDILRLVISAHVIPELIKFVTTAGGMSAHAGLMRKVGRNAVGMSHQERTLRAQFTQQFLVPAGLKILQMMEKISVEDLESTITTLEYSDFINEENQPNQKVREFLHDLIPLALRTDFSLEELELKVDMGAVRITINAAIGPYLSDLCEVIKRWDCDYLVLSGRPSCLSTIQSVLRKTPPVEPSRIVPMSDYPIESWYPFETPDGMIDDPKTTGVVGALLSAISEGNLTNFNFKTSELKPASTIKYIGPMGANKQILNKDLFFEGKNLDSLDEEDVPQAFSFAAPIYIGFRQIKAERWKTTPFYYLKFANQEAIERSMRHGRPYTIQFTYRRRFDDDLPTTDRSENEGVFLIEEIIAEDGTSIPRADLDLQLKSLADELGHWLDTGIVEFSGTVQFN